MNRNCPGMELSASLNMNMEESKENMDCQLPQPSDCSSATVNIFEKIPMTASLRKENSRVDKRSSLRKRSARAKTYLKHSRSHLQKMQECVSEFVASSEEKKCLTKYISPYNPKELFQTGMDKKDLALKQYLARKSRKKGIEKRFFKANRGKASFQMELKSVLPKKKRKKSKTIQKTLYGDNFLGDSLKDLSFNQKLIKKNKLRLFFRQMRTELSGGSKGIRQSNQSTKRCYKIRKIEEKPFKVLDSPGMANDFYTHTQAVSKDGLLFITLKGIVYSFCLANNKTQKIKTSFQNSPSCIATGPDGHTVAIGDIRGNLNLIDVNKNCYLFKSKVHSSRLGVAQFLNSNVLITGGKDSCLKVVDFREGKPEASQSNTPILITQTLIKIHLLLIKAYLFKGNNNNFR